MRFYCLNSQGILANSGYRALPIRHSCPSQSDWNCVSSCWHMVSPTARSRAKACACTSPTPAIKRPAWLAFGTRPLITPHRSFSMAVWQRCASKAICPAVAGSCVFGSTQTNRHLLKLQQDRTDRRAKVAHACGGRSFLNSQRHNPVEITVRIGCTVCPKVT